MGIQGLIPFLEKSSKPVNLSEFSGCTVAVDAYCWLHKGVYTCAEKLARGEDCLAYVHYCMRLVHMLLSKNIKPILVFDGQYLPAKADTESKRRKLREQNRKKAAELLRLGKGKEASSLLRRSIDVTHQMALNLIKKCREINVDCLTAPYEADSQLAYLNLSGIAHLVITEDSDLLVFGCKKVLFKLDQNGGGLLIEQEKLHFSMNVQPENFTQDKFRYMCILSGCDYIPSVPGVGLKTANKFISRTSETDVFKILSKFSNFINSKISPEYRDQFINADRMFQYQPIFDPLSRKIRPLNEMTDSNVAVLDSKLTSDEAYQLVLGNIDPISLKVVDDWDPEVERTVEKKKVAPHKSVWSKDYHPSKNESNVSTLIPEVFELNRSPVVSRKIIKNVTLKSPTNEPPTTKKRSPMAEDDILNTLEEIYENENDGNKIVTKENPTNCNIDYIDHIKKSPEINSVQSHTGVLAGLKKSDKRKFTVLNPEKQVVSGYFSTQTTNNFEKDYINPFKRHKISTSTKEKIDELNASFNSDGFTKDSESPSLKSESVDTKNELTSITIKSAFCWKNHSDNLAVSNDITYEEPKYKENEIVSNSSQNCDITKKNMAEVENKNDIDEGFCSQNTEEPKSTPKPTKRSYPRTGLSKNSAKKGQSLLSQFGFKAAEQFK